MAISWDTDDSITVLALKLQGYIIRAADAQFFAAINKYDERTFIWKINKPIVVCEIKTKIAHLKKLSSTKNKW